MRPTRDSGGAGYASSPIRPCSGWGLPCDLCLQRPGALLPHPFTLACAPEGAIGGLLSAALSVALRRPGVTRHPALWSSDFPPADPGPRTRSTSDPHSHAPYRHEIRLGSRIRTRLNEKNVNLGGWSVKGRAPERASPLPRPVIPPIGWSLPPPARTGPSGGESSHSIHQAPPQAAS